jgi:hypothetical protein
MGLLYGRAVRTLSSLDMLATCESAMVAERPPVFPLPDVEQH